MESQLVNFRLKFGWLPNILDVPTPMAMMPHSVIKPSNKWPQFKESRHVTCLTDLSFVKDQHGRHWPTWYDWVIYSKGSIAWTSAHLSLHKGRFSDKCSEENDYLDFPIGGKSIERWVQAVTRTSSTIYGRTGRMNLSRLPRCTENLCPTTIPG